MNKTNYNFENLKNRVEGALNKTDLEYIRYELTKLRDATLVTGVGGSSVVSTFAEKVLSERNRIIVINREPRDLSYQSLNNFKNIIACSYSGNNYGVDLAFNNLLTKYLFSSNFYDNDKITYLNYSESLEKESSFISLGATLVPLSILMNYYCNDKNLILNLINNTIFEDFDSTKVYEIFSGYDTKTASVYLESTFIEAGIGIPIVHDKYAYCHGRSTTVVDNEITAIYFNKFTELDKLLLEELKKYYKDIIVIDSVSTDNIIDDFSMLIKSMYLSKLIAEKNNKGLSNVNYNPIVKKLYRYKGSL